MLLTLTTWREPASDLGFLLHKHPDRVQSFSLPFGEAVVFYPEATEERCSATLLLEIDPVGLVRRAPGDRARSLFDYVNDRPYAASSFVSVAIARVFASALRGVCDARPELALTAIPLSAELPAVPALGGESVVRRLFEPLGYTVEVSALELDSRFPEWGSDRHVSLRLSGVVRLSQLLTHLYVLLPVLDDDKHYWVSEDEIAKLLRHGEGWLSSHPERELITRRYLKHQRSLWRDALAQLEDLDIEESADADAPVAEDALEETVRLQDQRLGSVVSVLKAAGARRVLDLGCGSGQLIELLVRDGSFEEIVGADISMRSLGEAARRLRLDRLPEAKRERVRLLQSALTYRDTRLAGYDAAVLVEVVEHLDPARLVSLEQNVFGSAQPRTVVVTTPNADYNVRWETLPAGEFRHPDHRFEWTREQLGAWAAGVRDRFGYAVRFLPVGPVDPDVGSPTQMAVFSR
ncbi:MAG TPA: 3' terminal RNA ribose 2'-O-methyltransferase Hen1 [Solirubrobacteraceae bacterium]